MIGKGIIDERLIIKKYTTDNLSASKIAKELGICINTVIKYLRKNNIKVENHQNASKFDETIFDNIDKEEKAYWLGFIFADGYISKNCYKFELSLSIKDKDHLDKFNSFMKHRSNNVKLYKTKCRWFIRNKHLWNTLNNLGCTPRKSLTLKFPKIDQKFYKDFIRGYFDGDGCLTYYRKSNGIKPKAEFLGTIDMLINIKSILSIKKINSEIYTDKRLNSSIKILRISQPDTIEFIKYIYIHSSVYLDRKYYRYQLFTENSRSNEELLELLMGKQTVNGVNPNTVLTK